MTRFGPWVIPAQATPEVRAVLEQVLAAKADPRAAQFYEAARLALPRVQRDLKPYAGGLMLGGALSVLAGALVVMWMMHVWPSPRPQTELFFKLLFGGLAFLIVAGGGWSLSIPIVLALASGTTRPPEPSEQIAGILAVARGKSLVAVATERGWKPEDLQAWGQAWLEGGVRSLMR